MFYFLEREEAEEAVRKEKEKREQEYQEKIAKLDEMERKRKEREKEIEERESAFRTRDRAPDGPGNRQEGDSRDKWGPPPRREMRDERGVSLLLSVHLKLTPPPPPPP